MKGSGAGALGDGDEDGDGDGAADPDGRGAGAGAVEGGRAPRRNVGDGPAGSIAGGNDGCGSGLAFGGTGLAIDVGVIGSAGSSMGLPGPSSLGRVAR